MRGVGAFASYFLTVACLLAGHLAVSGIPAVAGFPAVTGISVGPGILNLAGVSAFSKMQHIRLSHFRNRTEHFI
jgi:hypothetical protein